MDYNHVLLTPLKSCVIGKSMFDRVIGFFSEWLGTTILILFCVVSVFCLLLLNKSPLSSEKSSNPSFEVEFLFEKDGVKVYRFYDGGRPIYYINSQGSIQWTEFTGKTSHEMQVNTVN